MILKVVVTQSVNAQMKIKGKQSKILIPSEMFTLIIAYS